jgi:CheY-like chemotaxis protein
MGLALNARDAMPPEKGGGELRITTQEVALDSASADTHPGAKPGLYVQLAVIDTGEGMDAATMQHLFEPFFTTKEVGKGSGLGLAVVYGIIRQHNGWIDVHSQPGHGTRFDIYLPVREPGAQEGPAPRSRSVLGMQETILVAEDEDGVRELVCGVLQSLGYRVVAASDGREALRLFEADPQGFDLALLDAVMPQLTGVKAYAAMAGIRPNLPVLFVSGYSAEMVGVPPAGPRLRLLQKPFAGTELARAVREILAEV